MRILWQVPFQIFKIWTKIAHVADIFNRWSVISYPSFVTWKSEYILFWI